MPIRIAAVSFLNALPLAEGIPGLAGGDVQLVFDLPSRLPEMLTEGEADVALLPVIEYLQGVGAALVGETGIATIGPVGSVKLFSRIPLKSLSKVAVDRGSRTSVALLRIILAERYGVEPRLEVRKPSSDGVLAGSEEAFLVIGDRCLAYEARLNQDKIKDVQAHDLGAQWRKLTGKPFVFAAWTVSRDFLDRSSSEQRVELFSLLRGAREYGQRHLAEIAAREAAAGRLGLAGKATPEAIERYFRHSLRFVIGEPELQGIRSFRELCRRRKLLTAERPLVMIKATGEVHCENKLW